MGIKIKNQKTTYIANGRHFKSMQKVEDYAKENNWIVQKTETLAKGIHLITLTGNHENEK